MSGCGTIPTAPAIGWDKDSRTTDNLTFTKRFDPAGGLVNWTIYQFKQVVHGTTNERAVCLLANNDKNITFKKN